MLFVVIAHDIESSFCPPPLLPPLPPPRPARPRTRFGIPVFRPASKTTPSYRKIELLVKTASFVEQGYITSRVSRYRCPRFTACTSISISTRDYGLRRCAAIRREKKKKKTKTRRDSFSLFSFFFFFFFARSKGGFVVRESTTEELVGYTEAASVTQWPRE